MHPDWHTIDRWLMGEACVGSCIADHIHTLCDQISTRWAGTDNERTAAEYVASCLDIVSLERQHVESFDLQTADCHNVSVCVIGDSWQLDARPCLFCPSVNVVSPLVDVGFGMPHELNAVQERLCGSVALIQSEYEPFSEPQLLTLRLRELANHGVAAALTGASYPGRRMMHLSVADWRDNPTSVPLPLVQTSREDAARLKRRLSHDLRVAVHVESSFRTTDSWNAFADLPGTIHPDDSILLAAHHDTTPDSFGANDNAAGVAVLVETARLLSQLSDELDVRPGRTIRFASFGAEEQGLQGSTAFVERHYGPERPPQFMLALDELCTGSMKGVVLQFPELQRFVQEQLDSLKSGLQCHVLSQLDASGDMFPFSRLGIPAGFLWRWRFVGRHPNSSYSHSSSDTPEKVRIGELKEYAGLLSRLLLRLSLVPADQWPENQLDVNEIARRIDAERGTVVRNM